MRIAIIALLFGTISCKSITNNLDAHSTGKCYAKCIFPTQYIIKKDTFFQYTGDKITNNNVKLNTILVSPSLQVWEKKKSPYPCSSIDPEDCLVWCLINKEAVIDSIYTVSDTTKIKEFKVVIKESKSLKSYSYTDWTEVVCENKISNNLILNLSKSLVKKNFLVNETDSYSEEFKMAIQAFQQENNLPFGQLTTETVNLLLAESNDNN